MMSKLRVEDLARIQERVRRTTLLREGAGRARVIVHMGTCGIAAGARTIMEALLRYLEEHDVRDVIITTSGCAGLCSREPMATVELAGEAPVKYVDLTEKKIQEIFERHILGRTVVTEYALAVGSERTH
jgi:NADP-reducing hydrogenase subunit HndB